MPELWLHNTPEEAAQALAGYLASMAEECLATRGRFTIALSGGSTPRRLYEVLASPPYGARTMWYRWHVFWGDERCVPPEHGDSNYRMAREELLDHVPIPLSQVHRIRGEAPPNEAAEEYETVVRDVFQMPVPSFDLILLGLGDDGHTASLFPDSEALQRQDALVLANRATDLKAHRITFTLPLIDAAREVAFLVTDGSKSEALRHVLEPTPGQRVPPAALVRPAHGIVRWFVTRDAAALVKQVAGSARRH